MAKYILVKKVKGKKYEYQVIDADSKARLTNGYPSNWDYQRNTRI